MRSSREPVCSCMPGSVTSETRCLSHARVRVKCARRSRRNRDQSSEGSAFVECRAARWKNREASYDLSFEFRSAETLEQFLQDEPGGEHGATTAERVLEGCDLWLIRWRVPPQSKRPHARIDKENHRCRSRL